MSRRLATLAFVATLATFGLVSSVSLQADGSPLPSFIARDR